MAYVVLMCRLEATHSLTHLLTRNVILFSSSSAYFVVIIIIIIINLHVIYYT